MDFEQWMRLDMQYIDNWSLGLDARIILRTDSARVVGTRFLNSAKDAVTKFSITVRSSGRALRRSRSASKMQGETAFELRSFENFEAVSETCSARDPHIGTPAR